MPRCKATEVLRNEAYFGVRRNDEGRGQRRRWAFFISLLVVPLLLDVVLSQVDIPLPEDL